MDNGVIEAWKNADKKMMRNPILVGALPQEVSTYNDFCLNDNSSYAVNFEYYMDPGFEIERTQEALLVRGKLIDIFNFAVLVPGADLRRIIVGLAARQDESNFSETAIVSQMIQTLFEMFPEVMTEEELAELLSGAVL